ncbi:hypothetical protein MCAP1_003195 [Malassezia caprae]|uniref:Phospholipid/glycerol acyltransferase domain-containing protein n=1 Tax=Malassezia caprae TaxID=1381934 RepID=A0AAF0E8L0_9BASI|nr:hypothetical protein MCAP1_003195 [Malassezia caprae]
MRPPVSEEASVSVPVVTKHPGAQPAPLPADVDKAAKALSAEPQPAAPKTDSALKRTLQYVEADLMQMLSSLPIPLNGVLPKVLVRYMARVLHRGRFLATDILYDTSLASLCSILMIFFREVQPRSSWHIPAKGPIIFVCAPHHNQFLDPLMVASEVRKAGRRVSFLIAHKSTKRPFIGRLSRMLQSIPVRRAADDAKVGVGHVTVHPSGDPSLLQGIDTQFTKQLEVYGQIVLPKETEYASAHVAEVLSDTEVRLMKPFAEEAALDALQGKIPSCGTAGSRYKCFPHINQSEMYASVYHQLSNGGCLCIFPEGGSHDRTDLLPLKAGVVIMALGAMANDPNLNVQIVPVGLSYFHPHKFRSRAVIEFGVPLRVPPGLVDLFKKGGEEKRDAIASMLDIVFDGLKSVTVRTPDYDTLMMIQASRRLMSLPGQHLSLADKVEQNRKLIMGYMQFKDHPKVVALREAVVTYNKHLKQVGIRDHQVERANRSILRSFALLLYRLGLLCFWGGCALPGTVLNLPVIILAKWVSHRKAKEALNASQVKLYGRDVLATWKVLVSLGVTPVLYSAYAGLATYWAYRARLPLVHKRLMPLYVMFGLPMLSYSAIKISEVGMDVYKSLPPLIASLLPGRRRVIERIQQERVNLTSQLFSTIAELEPEGWNYTDIARGSYTAQAPPRPEELDQLMKHGTVMTSSGGHSLSHPMNLVDEWLFGWRTAQNKDKWGAHRDELSGDLGPDYDEAISVYNRSASDAEAAAAAAANEASPLRRRPRHRKSQEYRQRLKKGSLEPEAFTPKRDRNES